MSAPIGRTATFTTNTSSCTIARPTHAASSVTRACVPANPTTPPGTSAPHPARRHPYDHPHPVRLRPSPKRRAGNVKRMADADIAVPAALLGDPGRARVLLALLD